MEFFRYFEIFWNISFPLTFSKDWLFRWEWGWNPKYSALWYCILLWFPRDILNKYYTVQQHFMTWMFLHNRHMSLFQIFMLNPKMALISTHHIAIPMNRKQSIVKISILKRGKCNVFKNEVYSTETNLSSAMFFNELVPFRTPKVVCHCAFNVQTIMILLFYSFDVLLKTSHQWHHPKF